MLIKRDVFDKLNAHPAVRTFANDIVLPRDLDQYMKTYFDTAVREGRYYSEDWTFCENWRDLGGQVWVDKRVLLRHTGTYVFDGQTQEHTYKALRELYDPAGHQAAQAAQAAQEAAAAQATAEPQAEVMASSAKKKPKKVANKK